MDTDEPLRAVPSRAPEPRLDATGVDLGGLLDLLGSHLYSSPGIVLREVVQNAHDSVTRRRLTDPSWSGGRIDVRCEPARRRLTVGDDGAGMTADELQADLATIGAGATRRERDASGSDELIGMFGIGFLSVFRVAEEVTVTSTSTAVPGEGWTYRSRDGRRYALSSAPASATPGTEILLELTEEHGDLADPETAGRLLAHFCRLLDVPVFLDDATEPVNLDPPWRGGSDLPTLPVQLRRARMAFVEGLDDGSDPLCVLPVAPTRDSDARGLLWIHGGRSYATSDNRQLAVHVRGMLVDDEARDMLPRWAGFVSGIVESERLAPTAAREDLHRDDAYAATQSALREALIEGLAAVARDEPETWRRVLRRHNQTLTGAALVDPRLFDLLADDLLLPSADGEASARELARRGDGRVHVGLARGGFEEMLFRALGVPIADGGRYAVLGFLQRWCEQRGVELVEVGSERGDRRLFEPVPVSAEVRARLTDAFGREGWEIVPSGFEPTALPFVLVPDREAELKRTLEADDAEARMGAAALRLARRHVTAVDDSVAARLYVNLRAPAIAALVDAASDSPAAGHAVAVLCAVLAVLSTAAGTAAAGSGLQDALAAAGEAVVAMLEEG